MSSLTSMDIDDNKNDHSVYFSNIETTYQAIIMKQEELEQINHQYQCHKHIDL